MKREQAEKIVYCGHTRDDYIALEVAMAGKHYFGGDAEKYKVKVIEGIEMDITSMMKKNYVNLSSKEMKLYNK